MSLCELLKRSMVHPHRCFHLLPDQSSPVGLLVHEVKWPHVNLSIAPPPFNLSRGLISLTKCKLLCGRAGLLNTRWCDVPTFYRNAIQRLQVEGIKEGFRMQRCCCPDTADSQSLHAHSHLFVRCQTWKNSTAKIDIHTKTLDETRKEAR